MGRCWIRFGRWGRGCRRPVQDCAVLISDLILELSSKLLGSFVACFSVILLISLNLLFATYSLLFVFHGVDQLEELGAVYYFDEGLALGLVADHVNCRSVIDADALAQILVLIDSFG